jgi:hypothetical protein
MVLAALFMEVGDVRSRVMRARVTVTWPARRHVVRAVEGVIFIFGEKGRKRERCIVYSNALGVL